MPNCTSCGIDIPTGQGKSCSMCYGDINHGSDGYYQAWAREQMKREEERDLEEQRHYDELDEARMGDRGVDY